MEIACIPPEKAVSWLGLAPDVRPAGKEDRGPLDYDKLLTLTGELGYRLMMSGAEIYRVEESVRYLLGAYGVDTGEVFAIPNCLIVSLRASGQRPLTVVRRIPGHGTDIYRMEALNDLCRRLCQEGPDLDEAWVRLDRVLADHTQFPTAGQLFGYALGAAAFCLFFGGTLRDALCGGLCGLAIGASLLFMARLGTNLFFKTIAGGFVCALLAVALTVVGLGQHASLIITGAIMTLVPGIVITNFMRDIIAGDLISGLIKLAEALLTATGIALGTGLALALTRLIWGVV